MAAAEAGDLATLIALNRDYIDSVQRGDVRRFDEILADDFVCSNPDGSLVDRVGFLEQTARPVTIADLAAHDVDVRLLDDVAITTRARHTPLPRVGRDPAATRMSGHDATAAGSPWRRT